MKNRGKVPMSAIKQSISRTLSRRWPPLVISFGVLLAAVLTTTGAWAKKAPTDSFGGRVKLTPAAGVGSVELTAQDKVFRGSFFINNTGSTPVVVEKVVRRHKPQAELYTPAGFTVLPGAKMPLVIPPKGKHEVKVSWDPTSAKAKELYAHVLVSWHRQGDKLGGRPAAIGVHAEKPNALGFIGTHVLSIMVFLPLLALLIIFIAHLMGYKDDQKLKWVTVGVMGLEVLLAIFVYLNFDPTFLKSHGNDGFQFIERGVWIRSLHAEFFVGIDGISVTMVLLTALVSFCGAIASFSVSKQLKGYWAMYNLLVCGMMGTFVALDLVLFFLFWEVMLLPMYFLIGIWGGPRRQYAAIKFFLYTLLGSVLMLLAFIFFYLNADPTYMVDGQAVNHTLSVPELARMGWADKHHLILGMSAVKVLWVGLFIGFAIKIPMFPFHTWLPDAHVEAPTAISVILAGVLLKMGTYGILRFNFTLLPQATQWAAVAMAVFGVINIVYGAFCAFAQTDLKRLVAYSSVSHMGFCLLALGAVTPQGIEACLVQMFNHGLITSMMFTLVGVVYDRVHTRDIDKFGGMASEMPLYSAFFAFAFMASLGLPGLSGFWGEIMTFIGAFPRYRIMVIIAATGVIITAGYHLWALQRVFLGKFREHWRKNKYLKPFDGKFPEINFREIFSLAPLAILVLLLGFYPRPLLHLIEQGSLQMHRWVDKPGPFQISQLTPPMHKLAWANSLQVPSPAEQGDEPLLAAVSDYGGRQLPGLPARMLTTNHPR